MAVSESQKIAIAKYRQENRDRISTDVPKGKRAIYNCAAKTLGLSLSMLIQNGVEEYITNHAGENFSPTIQNVASGTKLSAAEKQLVEEFNQLPVEVQKHFLNVFKAINESKGGDKNGNE